MLNTWDIAVQKHGFKDGGGPQTGKDVARYSVSSFYDSIFSAVYAEDPDRTIKLSQSKDGGLTRSNILKDRYAVDAPYIETSICNTRWHSLTEYNILSVQRDQCRFEECHVLALSAMLSDGEICSSFHMLPLDLTISSSDLAISCLRTDFYYGRIKHDSISPVPWLGILNEDLPDHLTSLGVRFNINNYR